MVTMAIEHHHQSRTIAFTLEVFNALFTTIFGLGKYSLIFSACTIQ